jgi:bifunctional UDP-N-acetylglucosamine pyrophosphorylase/glucosamine-1-phosphate N-acetyltransferase
MQSKTPKVLHKLMGKPLLQYPVEACKKHGIDSIVLVISPEIDVNRDIPSLLNTPPIEYVIQEKPLGTGHAVMAARQKIEPDDDVVILFGDMPLITSGFIGRLSEFFHTANADAVVTVVQEPGSSDFGRVYAGKGDVFEKIVEQKDLKPGEPVPDLVNAGVCIFKGKALLAGLEGISNCNSQNEYYLTDVPGVLRKMGCNVRIYRSDSPAVMFTGINSQMHLAEAVSYLKMKINARHMNNGVQMVDPLSTYIDDVVEIANDVVIYPGVILEGNCKIETGAVIGPNSRLVNTFVGMDTHIQYSVLNDAVVGSGSEVGPFAFLRPGAVIGENCRVGDFVEVKNSNIGNRTKISHLGYVGDSDVGENVNWGCGAITANYDGKHKHRTTVRDNVFVGCNTNLIAPVTLGEGAFIAAGSTITDDVPPAAFAIARQRQAVKTNWKKNKYTE